MHNFNLSYKVFFALVVDAVDLKKIDCEFVKCQNRTNN
jgi:hypothetical protein